MNEANVLYTERAKGGFQMGIDYQWVDDLGFHLSGEALILVPPLLALFFLVRHRGKLRSSGLYFICGTFVTYVLMVFVGPFLAGLILGLMLNATMAGTSFGLVYSAVALVGPLLGMALSVAFLRALARRFSQPSMESSNSHPH